MTSEPSTPSSFLRFFQMLNTKSQLRHLSLVNHCSERLTETDEHGQWVLTNSHALKATIIAEQVTETLDWLRVHLLQTLRLFIAIQCLDCLNVNHREHFKTLPSQLSLNPIDCIRLDPLHAAY
jgi:hypothetical protein